MTRRRTLGTIVLLALVTGGVGWLIDDWRWVAGSAGTIALILAGWLIAWRARRRRRRLRGPRRAPIPGALRQQIYRRDAETCRYCGRRGRGVRLELDHVFPVSRGGTDRIGNLVTACRECNRAKGAMVLGDERAMARFVAERRDWAETLSRAARRRAILRNVVAPILLLAILAVLYLVLSTFVW
jgi:5-methylcytosine-specific restriction endonuclease McrA